MNRSYVLWKSFEKVPYVINLRVLAYFDAFTIIGDNEEVLHGACASRSVETDFYARNNNACICLS